MQPIYSALFLMLMLVSANSLQGQSGSLSRLAYHITGNKHTGTFQPTRSNYYRYSGDNVWDSLHNDWKYDERSDGYERIVKNYDVNGYLLSYENQFLSNQQFLPILIISYTYNNGHIAGYTEKTVDNKGKWRISKEATHTYDSIGRLIETTSAEHPIVSGPSDAKWVYTYGPNGLELTELLYKWGAQSAWYPQIKTEVQHSSGRKEKEIYYYYKNNMYRERSRKVHNYINANETILYEINSEKIPNDTSEIVWHNTADKDNDTLLSYTKGKNGFEPSHLQITKLNTSGQPLVKTYFLRDTAGKSWRPNIEEYFEYFDFNLSIPENNTQSQDIKLYPLPANKTLNLSLQTLPGEKVTLSIYTIDGRCLKSWITLSDHTNMRETIDVSQIAQGRYILHVAAKGQQQSKLFDILR